ncbi:MAG: endolytic transglycosylase MltG, partial [Bdellovibrionota bacterium]
NRYNTYSFTGLPYGPISNPGYEALRAAFAPVESDFLFFVSKNDGTHIFSKDFGAHQKAVGTFQLDRKAREGKSWRDLKKRPKAASQK